MQNWQVRQLDKIANALGPRLQLLVLEKSRVAYIEFISVQTKAAPAAMKYFA